MNFFRFASAVVGLALGFISPVSAEAGHAPNASVHASAANETAIGEVRKVDRSGKRLTIDHGPIRSVGMQAMTMAFRVNDEAMLDMVKPGDKVRFRIERINGRFILVQLELVR